MRNPQWIGKKNPKYKDGRSLIQHYCLDCKKPITRQAIRCSSCATKISIKKVWDKKGRQEWKCIDCNIKISRDRTRCRQCFNKFQSGENHPCWIDGRKQRKYPLEFNNKLKESIRYRDNHKCKNCSMTDEEHIIVLGYHLTVHHIDYNKFNNSPINLITLCNQCNVRANTNREIWKIYYQNIISNLIVAEREAI